MQFSGKFNLVILLTVSLVGSSLNADAPDLSSERGRFNYVAKSQLARSPEKAQQAMYVFGKLAQANESYKKYIADMPPHLVSDSVSSAAGYERYMGGRMAYAQSEIEGPSVAIDVLEAGVAAFGGPIGVGVAFGSFTARRLGRWDIEEKLKRQDPNSASAMLDLADELVRTGDPKDQVMGRMIRQEVGAILQLPDDLKKHPDVVVMQKVQRSEQEIKAYLEEQTRAEGEKQKVLLAELKDISDRMQAIEKDKALAKEKEDLNREFRRKMSDYQGSVSILAFGIENLGGNPVAAEGVRRLGGAVLSVMQASHARKEGEIGDIAMMATCLNAFTAIATISSLGQPSEGQIMMGMIAELRAQISELREVVVEGFARLDRTLAENFEQVFVRLNAIELQGRDILEQIVDFRRDVDLKLTVIDERLQKSMKDEHAKKLEKCFGNDLEKPRAVRSVSLNGFEVCLREVKYRALQSGGWTASELRSKGDFNKFRMVDLNNPYDEFLPNFVNFRNSFVDHSGAKKNIGKKSDVLILPTELVKLSQFRSEVANYLKLLELYPYFTRQLARDVGRTPISDLEKLNIRARDYQRLYQGLLIDSGKTSLNMDVIGAMIKEYATRAKDFAFAVEQRAKNPPKKEIKYHPGLAASDQSYTGLPLLGATAAIPLCEGKSVYGFSAKATDVALNTGGFSALPLRNGGFFGRFSKILPPANFNSLVPSAVAFAQAFKYGLVEACFSKVEITDIKNMEILAHGDRKYELHYEVVLNILYKPTVEFKGGEITALKKPVKAQEVRRLTFKGRILANKVKVLPTGIAAYSAGLAHALWYGATIDNSNSPGQIYCKHPKTASYCSLKVKGIVEDLNKGAGYAITDDQSVKNNLQKWNSEITRMIKTQHFSQDPDGGFRHWERLQDTELKAMGRVEEPLSYLTKMTFVSLASEFDKLFFDALVGDSGLFLSGEQIARMVFEKGESADSISKKIDERARALGQKYQTLNENKKRLSKVFGVQDLLTPIIGQLEGEIDRLQRR